jgi:hypothetical protein
LYVSQLFQELVLKFRRTYIFPVQHLHKHTRIHPIAHWIMQAHVSREIHNLNPDCDIFRVHMYIIGRMHVNMYVYTRGAIAHLFFHRTQTTQETKCCSNAFVLALILMNVETPVYFLLKCPFAN